MSVIVVLVGLMFPVVIGIRAKARNRQALVQAHDITVALKSYYGEFGVWPDQDQGALDRTYFTNNHRVILPLMGFNPRGKLFLTMQESNQFDAVSNYLDPWGVPYVICMDEDANGSCVISGISNTPYLNIYLQSPATSFYIVAAGSNSPVTNVDVAVASFAGATSPAKFAVESWSAPQ